MVALEGFVALMTVCSVMPAILFIANLWQYRRPMAVAGGQRVAVLIPARNEERTIGACLKSVLANRDVELEVLVLDDDSSDGTGRVVEQFMAEDSRVRLVRSAGLPPKWNGKQHACWLLSKETAMPTMLFLDADVRLQPTALRDCLGSFQSKRVALLSGFPRQVMGGPLEWMLLPLIHFVLLSYLPMGRMQKTTKPEYAAGCGQFLLVDRKAYSACGGHEAIRETRHDGRRLPLVFREHGFRTALVDLTELAEVRMYESASDVWQGLTKNATEGIGSPGRIVPFSVLLLMGQVVPWLLLAAWSLMRFAGTSFVGVARVPPILLLATALCIVAAVVPRTLAVWRFKQPWKSAVLHPFGVVLLVTVQWSALFRQVLGSPVSWRGRKYASGNGEEV